MTVIYNPNSQARNLFEATKMDLGSIINSAVQGYGSYQLAKLQQSNNSPWIPDAIERPLFPDRFTVTADPATGQVTSVKKCAKKRRRKRLATVSDIRDLAALKSVLGNGEAFKTWIATHSR